jgi:hypothetical protein
MEGRQEDRRNTEKKYKTKMRDLKIQAVVSWVVMPCSVVVGYQRFGGSFTPKMEAASSSETLILAVL